MSEKKPKKHVPRGTAEQVAINKVKFFHKHVVEGKTIVDCARETGMSKRSLNLYKKDEDFRQMALEHLENSKLKGLTGTITQLVKALDATKPVVTQDSDGTTHITHVPDQKTRLDALREVIKIYGLYAPERHDTTVTVTFSSDEDLFRQIDEAARACRFVESVEAGQGSPVLAEGESERSSRDFNARQRTLLQVDALPEPV